MKEKIYTRSSFFTNRLMAPLLIVTLFISTVLNAQIFVGPEASPFNLEEFDIFQTKLAFVDIDDDGDLDFFSGYSDNHAIIFQENIGTPELPDFSDTISNPFGINPSDGIISPLFGDLDNDGDYDMLITSYTFGSPWYFENIGSASAPSFATEEFMPFGLSLTTFIPYELIDIDNDGDLDIMGGQFDEGSELVSPTFIENIGTAEVPSFDTPAANPFGLDEVYEGFPMVDFVDLDEDGDQDFFVNFLEGSTIYYYENIGTADDPSWEGVEGIEDPYGISSLAMDEAFGSSTLVDIDNDGDKDLFASVHYGPTIYYENRTYVVSINESSSINFDNRVYPNPATESIWIATDLNAENCSQIIIYGVDGQKKFSTQQFTQEINVSTFESGMYIIQLLDVHGNVTQLKFLKK